MRTTVPLGTRSGFDPRGLRQQEDFLYRRVADQDRAVLGVGQVGTADLPTTPANGRQRDWLFGHLCYELGSIDRPVAATDAQVLGWPLSNWFVPRWVVEWKRGEAYLHVLPGDEEEGRAMAERVLRTATEAVVPEQGPWRSEVDRAQYLERAARLMQHIQRGDIYEVNYCIEQHTTARDFDPFAAFARLLQRTEAPFAGFYRLGQRFALCASPERFLAFAGSRVTGEPMKGTRPRANDREEDERLRAELAADPKERSENIMALDVMRHDLSRIAASRSVQVSELCAVRSYPRVHQLVSTVVAEIAAGRTPHDVVRAAFPMASMTGAPKISAMKLIEQAELRPRGLYSGTMGFFAPDGTADLNVVIRTLLFDEAAGQLSLTTGSALTAQCAPEHEWEECAVKARSVIDALGHDR